MQTLEANAPPRPGTTRGEVRRQTLMIDADDTLWENNIFFERAIDQFVALVEHPELSNAEVHDRFNDLEATRVKTHGYGVDAFHASLQAGFEHLTSRACNEAQLHALAACASIIRDAEVVLLRDVASTLEVLQRHHTLLLVTKGDHAEQAGKLRRSGLQTYFTHVEVLREKHMDAYLDLLAHHSLSAADTWMIGNSPRSDINPALAAGMHAVYVPHSSTWVLEQEAVAAPTGTQKLLQLTAFSELLHHFA